MYVRGWKLPIWRVILQDIPQVWLTTDFTVSHTQQWKKEVSKLIRTTPCIQFIRRCLKLLHSLAKGVEVEDEACETCAAASLWPRGGTGGYLNLRFCKGLRRKPSEAEISDLIDSTNSQTFRNLQGNRNRRLDFFPLLEERLEVCLKSTPTQEEMLSLSTCRTGKKWVCLRLM